MSSQFHFYRKVVPLSIERHAKWSVERPNRYDFVQGVSSVPLNAVEIPYAAREYTILFEGTGVPTPVALLGTETGQNLYMRADGSWNAHYVPAFIRRYPFLFALSQDGATLTLCIDESFSGCNQEGRGDALFDDKGERTAYLAGVLEFLQDYQGHFAHTERYSAKLQELGLLEKMELHVKVKDGGEREISGFQAVKREKLKELAGDKLADLAKSDELELCYAHLGSMQNFAHMLEHIAAKT